MPTVQIESFRKHDTENAEDGFHQSVIDLGVQDVRKDISAYTLGYKQKIIESIMSEIDSHAAVVDELKAMENQIRDIFSSLSPKTRCIMGIIIELESMHGYAVGIDYGNDLLFGTEDEEIETMLDNMKSDKDISFMTKAYRLVKKFKSYND
jgi:hypothetical protein